MSTNSQTAAGPAQQEVVNRAVYTSRGVYRHYLSEQLAPAEIACLLKYQPYFFGQAVLDVGVGAGRTTRYLAPLASRYEAIDYSPVMVDYLAKAMPDIAVYLADYQDLSRFGSGVFGFVFATNNVIDALSHNGRLKALSESCRVLRFSGVLAFSSHNLNYRKAFSHPELSWCANPGRFLVSVAQYLYGWTNYRRVARLRVVAPDYALINDSGHYYACLHYYATRATIARQLDAAGFRLLETFDIHGQSLTPGADDSDNPSLLYIAQKVGN